MMKWRKAIIFLAICFLLLCYYAYYTYYVNMLIPSESFLIKRDGSSGLMNVGYVSYRAISEEIKLTNVFFYFVMFGIGYLFSTWSLYGKKQIGLVLAAYVSILLISSFILLLSSFLPGHIFVYRAGAEIKNFVWSPIFLMLIILMPKLMNIRKKMNM